MAKERIDMKENTTALMNKLKDVQDALLKADDYTNRKWVSDKLMKMYEDIHEMLYELNDRKPL